MSVKLTTRQVGDVTVIDVAGRITLGEGSSALREAMRDLVGKSQKKILLNLGDVSYIDSSGIGEILRLFKLLRDRNGELVLLNPNRKLRELFTMYRFEKFMKIRDELGSAKE